MRGQLGTLNPVWGSPCPCCTACPTDAIAPEANLAGCQARFASPNFTAPHTQKAQREPGLAGGRLQFTADQDQAQPPARRVPTASRFAGSAL